MYQDFEVDGFVDVNTVRARDLCRTRKCVVSRRTRRSTEKHDGAGRLSSLPLLQTHFGVKVEA